MIQTFIAQHNEYFTTPIELKISKEQKNNKKHSWLKVPKKLEQQRTFKI